MSTIVTMKPAPGTSTPSRRENQGPSHPSIVTKVIQQTYAVTASGARSRIPRTK
jgi:hypothetical protein